MYFLTVLGILPMKSVFISVYYALIILLILLLITYLEDIMKTITLIQGLLTVLSLYLVTTFMSVIEIDIYYNVVNRTEAIAIAIALITCIILLVITSYKE